MLGQRRGRGPGPEGHIAGTSGRLAAALRVSGQLTKALPQRRQAGVGADGRRAQLQGQLSTYHESCGTLLCSMRLGHTIGNISRQTAKPPPAPQIPSDGEGPCTQTPAKRGAHNCKQVANFYQPWDSNSAGKVVKFQCLNHLGGHFQDITFTSSNRLHRGPTSERLRLGKTQTSATVPKEHPPPFT